MRLFAISMVLAASALGQSGNLGVFTNSGDIGEPAMKGSTVYDAATGQYKMTGAGVNMWAKADQFQYVWKEMTGNFAINATLEFLGTGADHRKAGIVLRKSMDTDSPYADLIIHGNGMPGVQWRTTKGDITNGFDWAFDGPGKYRLRLVRRGSALTVAFAKEGHELKEIGVTQVQLGDPVLAGLGVCSHDPNHSDTVVFSNVSVEVLAAAPAAGKKKK